jgi:hypothetical protein
LKSTYAYLFLFFTYFILPGVSTILFQMLRPCVDVDPEDSGRYYLSHDEEFVPCTDSGINIVAIVIMVVVCVAAAYLFTITCGAGLLAQFGKFTGLSFFSKAWLSKTMSLKARKKNFLRSGQGAQRYQSKLKQVMTMLQILIALPATTSFTFPHIYYRLILVFNVLNPAFLFSNLGLKCTFNGMDHVNTVMFATITPLVMSLLLYVVYRVHVHVVFNQYSEPFRIIANTYHRIDVLKSTYAYLFLFFTYFILPGVSTILFQMLRPCVDVDPEGSSGQSQRYLEADYNIECTSDRYKLGVVWAYVFVVLYPIGNPFLYLYLLVQAKDMILQQAHVNVYELDEDGLEQMERDSMQISALRFLYQEYEPEVSDCVHD